MAKYRNPGKYSGSDYLKTESLPWLEGMGYDPFSDGNSFGWKDFPQVGFRVPLSEESEFEYFPKSLRSFVDIGRVSLSRAGCRQLGAGYLLFRPSFVVNYYRYSKEKDPLTPFQEEIAISLHEPFSLYEDEVVSMIRLPNDGPDSCRLLAHRERYKAPIKPGFTPEEPWFLAVRAILARAHEVAESCSVNNDSVRLS